MSVSERIIRKISHLVSPTDNRAELVKRNNSIHTAGQTRETIAFTQREYDAGRMTREEKLRLDNLAIRNNALANSNGLETSAEERPGEWEKYLAPK